MTLISQYPFAYPNAHAVLGGWAQFPTLRGFSDFFASRTSDFGHAGVPLAQVLGIGLLVAFVVVLHCLGRGRSGPRVRGDENPW